MGSCGTRSTRQRPEVLVLFSETEGRPPGLEPLGSEARVTFASTAGELTQSLKRTDVLLVTDFRTRLLRQVWPPDNRIGWVHAASAGVDALMFPELIESRIPLTNAKGIFEQPIAEYVAGLVLAHAKDLRRTLQLNERRQWRHRETERVEGKHLVVVGAGSIGRHIGKIAKAIGTRITGIGSVGRDEDDVFGCVRPVHQLHDILPTADYVVLAAPLTGSTRGLFGRKEFERMKPGAYFVNIGRGQLVRTDELVNALRVGHIGGAALDVFEEEPLPLNHPLWSLPNVTVSPHMAGDVSGWREALSEQFLDNFRRWQRGEPLRNQVDKKRGYGTLTSD